MQIGVFLRARRIIPRKVQAYGAVGILVQYFGKAFFFRLAQDPMDIILAIVGLHLLLQVGILTAEKLKEQTSKRRPPKVGRPLCRMLEFSARVKSCSRRRSPE